MKPLPNRQTILTFVLVASLLLLTACQPIQPPSSSSSVNLTWLRTGGIAGFCDQVTVSSAGVVEVANCRTEPATAVSTLQLNNDQLAQVQGWLNKLSSFNHSQTDAPGAADAMTMEITFQGLGTQTATETDLAQINALMQDLVGQVGNK